VNTLNSPGSSPSSGARIGQIDKEGARAGPDTFLTWAQAHMKASDPLDGLNLPGQNCRK
jgi:hypothetical protein